MSELRVMTIRLDMEKHRQLRKLAFLTEKPVVDLVRDGIEIVLESYKKVLTNSDIVIS